MSRRPGWRVTRMWTRLTPSTWIPTLRHARLGRVPLRFPTSRAVEGMERRALADAYSRVVEEHALGWTAEAQDVAQHLHASLRFVNMSRGDGADVDAGLAPAPRGSRLFVGVAPMSCGANETPSRTPSIPPTARPCSSSSSWRRTYKSRRRPAVATTTPRSLLLNTRRSARSRRLP